MTRLVIRDRDELRKFVLGMIQDFDTEYAEEAVAQRRCAQRLIDADFTALGTAQLDGQGGEALRIVQKHRRHVVLSPGVGADRQQYAIAVCDDIIADLDAARSTQNSDNPR